MIDKILVLVPSRKRPSSIEKLRRSFLQTHANKSEILVILDKDDEQNYYRHHDLNYEVYEGEAGYAQEKMNGYAFKYHKEYKYIGFIGDDNEFVTKNWDLKIFSALEDIGDNAIAYIDDQLQNYCNANKDCCRNVFLDSNIINKLGYFAPPTLRHFYNDNFWFATGSKLKTLVYLEEIKVNHTHYLANLSERDEIYQSAYDSNKMHEDYQNYNEYLNKQWANDIKKLLNK